MDYKQKIDKHYKRVWAEYEAHLAGRGVLDERIRRHARAVLSQQDRTLIMIADVVSIGEFTQARFHMTNAIKLGIPPKQVLEICWLATLYAGMPKLYSAFLLKDVCDKLGVALDG